MTADVPTTRAISDEAARALAAIQNGDSHWETESESYRQAWREKATRVMADHAIITAALPHLAQSSDDAATNSPDSLHVAIDVETNVVCEVCQGPIGSRSPGVGCLENVMHGGLVLAQPSDEAALKVAVAAAGPWACCDHCADDDVHDVDLNGHDIPCQSCVYDEVIRRAALAQSSGRGADHAREAVATGVRKVLDRHDQFAPLNHVNTVEWIDAVCDALAADGVTGR